MSLRCSSPQNCEMLEYGSEKSPKLLTLSFFVHCEGTTFGCNRISQAECPDEGVMMATFLHACWKNVLAVSYFLVKV